MVFTALPLIPGNESWIRIWDFPRVQIAAVLLVILMAIPLTLRVRQKVTQVFLIAVIVALSWQVYRIWHYTPLFATEVKAANSCPQSSRIRLLTANVLISNQNAAPLLALVRRLDPDLIFLVETDEWWDRQLAPLKTAYPYALTYPQDNGYGMHFFSRFQLQDPSMRFLLEDYVPSIKTGVTLPSGAQINFYGLHPKPPPLQDTARRDAELLIVGREIYKSPLPAIVAGDLNDVAWSDTNRLFQETSGLLDPRIGRGLRDL